MKTLNQTILDAARDEVAREHDYADYLQIDMTDLEPSERTELKLSILENAISLAMEKQAAFYHWAMPNWIYYEESETWMNVYEGPELTELELYEIWEGQK